MKNNKRKRKGEERRARMSTKADLRARDSAITAKLDETLHEQQQLLDQHIDIQVCNSID